MSAIFLCLHCENNTPSDFDCHTCYTTNVEDEVNYIKCDQCGAWMEEWEWEIRSDEALGFDEQSDFFSPSSILTSLDHVYSDVTQSDKRQLLDSMVDIHEDYFPNPITSLTSTTSYSTDELHDMRKAIFQRPCKCGNTDPQGFQSIQDPQTKKAIEGLKYCLKCGECCGVDDTMYDYKDFLSKVDIAITPCVQCGNNMPEEFSVVEINDEIDLHCHACNGLISGVLLDKDLKKEEEDGFTLTNSEIVLMVECVCGNKLTEQFNVHKDDKGVPIKLECQVCKELLHLKPSAMQHLCCSCGNNNPNQLLVHYDEHGLGSVTCLLCDSNQKPNVETKKKVHIDMLPKSRVKCISELNEGDHIAWHRPLGYWHHALVVQVGYLSGQVKVIEYDGPVKVKGSILPRGIVKEQWKKTYPEREQLYKVQYKPGECVSAEEVIRIARQRLGENDYNLFTNNCEHFASSCKKGIPVCSQTENLKDTFKRIGMKLFNSIAQRGVRATIRIIATKAIKAPVGRVATSETLDVAASSVANIASCCIAVGTVAAVETAFLIRDIRRAYKMRKEKFIDAEVYMTFLLKRSVHAGVATLFGATGVVLGSLLIPVPFLGSIVGGTIGALIGHFLGPVLGRQAIEFREKNKKGGSKQIN